MFELKHVDYKIKSNSSAKATLLTFYLPISGLLLDVWIPNRFIISNEANGDIVGVDDWFVSKDDNLKKIVSDYNMFWSKNGKNMKPIYYSDYLYEPSDIERGMVEINECSEYFHLSDDGGSIGFVAEDVEPSDVDLTSFENQKKLNPRFFDESGKLRPKVRKQILKLADEFYQYLETPWLDVEDVLFMGSLTNYNWSSFSDVDIHLLVDLSKVDDSLGITEEYFKLKKWTWAEEHKNLNIYGYEVEMYVQDMSQQEKQDDSCYSVENDEWVLEPSYQVEPFNKERVKQLASKIMNKVDELYLDYEKSDVSHLSYVLNDTEKLWNKIKDMRKTGLDRSGIYDEFNIVFKVLRRTKYLEKITDLKHLIFDKQNSLNESKQNTGKDIKQTIQNLKKLPQELKDFAKEHASPAPYTNAKNGKVSKLNIPKEFKDKLEEEGLPTGFSVGVDEDGYFIHTHRARSKSYETLDKIPKKDIKFIDSTG